MTSEHPRLIREKRTIEAMLRIYCRGHHGSQDGLCSDCSELLEYAKVRLDSCPFQEKKPTCANCPVHCYQPQMRRRVREVMRYSGPRMIYRHPAATIWHMMDGRRKEPLDR